MTNTEQGEQNATAGDELHEATDTDATINDEQTDEQLSEGDIDEILQGDTRPKEVVRESTQAGLVKRQAKLLFDADEDEKAEILSKFPKIKDKIIAEYNKATGNEETKSVNVKDEVQKAIQSERLKSSLTSELANMPASKQKPYAKEFTRLVNIGNSIKESVKYAKENVGIGKVPNRQGTTKPRSDKDIKSTNNFDKATEQEIKAMSVEELDKLLEG